MDGKGSARPFLQTPFAEASGVLSPDGRFLADQSDESGKFEVFVRTFESPDEKWQISNDGGRQPVWARNGREIFYRNGDKMMAVPIDTEPAFRPGRPVELF
jgi:serine/threonine-protein kinase